MKIKKYQALFWAAPTGDPITRASEIPHDLSDHFNPMFKDNTDRGIYLAPNAYEVGFTSNAHEKYCHY